MEMHYRPVPENMVCPGCGERPERGPSTVFEFSDYWKSRIRAVWHLKCSLKRYEQRPD